MDPNQIEHQHTEHGACEACGESVGPGHLDTRRLHMVCGSCFLELDRGPIRMVRSVEKPKTDPPKKRFLTTKQTAAVLKVSKRTVNEWIREKRLPAVVVTPGRSANGRRYRVLEADLLHFLARSSDSSSSGN